MGLAQTVAPASDPITSAEAKLHLKVENSDDDALITVLIGAATAQAEAFQNRQYVDASYELTLDAFPSSNGRIWIPRPPLDSITKIEYVDNDGDTQTLSSDNYTAVTSGVRGYVVPAYGESWPTTRDIPEAVTVTFVAGYGELTDVPDEILAAIKLFLGTLYEHREDWGEVKLHQNPAAERLLWPDRVMEGL